MNVISSVNAVTAMNVSTLNSKPAATPESTPLGGAITESAPSLPSAIVTLSGQTYSPVVSAVLNSRDVKIVSVWASKSQDAISTMMASNYKAPTLAGRFKDLGTTLLNRFKATGSSFSQSVKQVRADGTLDPTNLYKGLAASVTLSIKTASGTEVKLSLESQGAGLAVSIEGGDNLSDKERDAIADLAGGFQDALNGLASVPPSPNLGGLTQFDPKVLASVDLQEGVSDGSSPASITFHADKDGRSVKLSGAAGKLEVGVDTSNPLIQADKAQRAASVSNYLHQVDAAATRGHGDQTLIDMFKNTFVQMNNDYGPPDTSAYKAPLAARDQATLTGLADFHASVSANSRLSNPLRLNEVDEFSWDASQSTHVGGESDRDRTISQQQQAHLVASYHNFIVSYRAVLLGLPPPTLKLDKTTQYYYYDQINDTAQSQLDIGYQDGELVNATLSQSASQNQHETKFELAEQVKETTTPAYQAQSLNLLELLKSVGRDGKAKPEHKNEDTKPVLDKVHTLIQLQTTQPGLQ